MSAEQENIDFDMPDIPLPDETKTDIEIKDKFDSAIKYSFIGVGQGGSRIAEAFHGLGYGRVCVVNTAKQDLDDINLPEDRKLWLGVGGAAKNRRLGSSYIKERAEEVMALMRKSFGSTFDRIMVCATAGGGTGSGGFEVVAQVANELTELLRIKKAGEESRVGIIIALPSNAERDRMTNAYEAMKAVSTMLDSKLVSPVVIVDNEQIAKIYPSATVGNVWGRTNQSIVTLFHLFNQIAGRPSKYVSFDPEDYLSVLRSGVVTYGAMPIKATSKDDVAMAFRDNLKKNVLLGGVDVSTSKVAACLIVGEASTIEGIPWDVVEHAYEMLGRSINGGMVHRGIYTSKKPLSAYTIIGGLQLPKARLDEIAKLSGRKDWDE